MRYVHSDKFNREVIENTDISTPLIINGMTIQQRESLVKYSRRLINPRLIIGYDQDDFINDMTTLMVKWDSYKVPRIVKNMLLK